MPARRTPSISPRRASRRVVLCAALGSAGLAGTTLACSRGATTKAPSTGPAPDGASAPRPGGTLQLYNHSNPETLDPQRILALANLGGLSGVLGRLLRFKAGPDPRVAYDHQLENSLAISVESPDAATWTVRLRPDAKFHNIAPVNGHPVEAEDIKATFKRAVDPKSPVRGQFNMLNPDRIQTPAKNTVVFPLEFPYASFPAKLASPKYSWIFPREALVGQYDPAKQVIGTGPFILDSYTPDVALVYKKNPDWFEKSLPYIDGIREAVIPGVAQAITQFRGSNLDVLSPGENDVEAVRRDNPKAQIIAALNSGGRAATFQLGDRASPFQDIRLRRAVCLAINQDAISKTLFHGQAIPQFSVPLALGRWSLAKEELDPSVAQYYTFNLDLAKRLVEEAGATNLALKFLYATGYLGPDFEAYAQAIYSMLSALPWKITLTPIDYQSEFIGKGIRQGNYPGDTIVFSGITNETDVDDVLYNYFDSQSTTNQSRLKDPQIDDMIRKARTLVMDSERIKAYKDIQKYIAQQAYTGAGMPYGYAHTFVQPWAHDYYYSAGGAEESDLKVWLTK